MYKSDLLPTGNTRPAEGPGFDSPRAMLGWEDQGRDPE